MQEVSRANRILERIGHLVVALQPELKLRHSFDLDCFMRLFLKSEGDRATKKARMTTGACVALRLAIVL